ncbi:protein LOL5 [Typha angustifolia]|uniref:protein LOL5 n=1 Tax=Typha angustifolia TaxID=59011 RepID=UPI003C2F5037
MAGSPETAPPGYENLEPQPPTPLPPPSTPLLEIGQMVCGSCHQLLCYLRGSIHVQCACCQTVNFVLEAHQVGNVKCGNCSVLLMYPHGAPSVRCSSCCSVTEIGPHNTRQLVSVQQGQPAPP